jgi:hypothetical protein
LNGGEAMDGHMDGMMAPCMEAWGPVAGGAMGRGLL